MVGNHWAWKAENLRRNAIDSFTSIEGATFAETMSIHTAAENTRHLHTKSAAESHPRPQNPTTTIRPVLRWQFGP
jgi:hypothetical protein